MSDEQKFSAKVEGTAKRAFIKLPFDPDAEWGAKQQHHVRGSVNTDMIRGPLGSDANGSILVLPPAWLRDHGLSPGDAVDVVVAPEGPQLVSLDEDIAAALSADPAARDFFESLATFYRKAYLKWLEGAARRPEVRRQRIEEFIELLAARKKARD